MLAVVGAKRMWAGILAAMTIGLPGGLPWPRIDGCGPWAC